MNIQRGYIKLYRSVCEDDLWLSEPFTKGQAWIDLLLLANHKPNSIIIKNGELINIERGQCGYSLKALAERWGWSRGKVSRYFAMLNAKKRTYLQHAGDRYIITILNYEKYQDSTTNRHQTEQQTDINNNDKNEKNIYRPQNKKFQKPSLEEVQAYCLERGNSIDAQKFIDYNESRGWIVGKSPMKDWKAAVRTWENNSKVYQSQNNETYRREYYEQPYNPML